MLVTILFPRPLERVPVFAIGGVTPGRAVEARRAGAHGVAVVSSILSAPDVPAAVRAFLRALHEAGPSA